MTRNKILLLCLEKLRKTFYWHDIRLISSYNIIPISEYHITRAVKTLPIKIAVLVHGNKDRLGNNMFFGKTISWLIVELTGHFCSRSSCPLEKFPFCTKIISYTRKRNFKIWSSTLSTFQQNFLHFLFDLIIDFYSGETFLVYNKFCFKV